MLRNRGTDLSYLRPIAQILSFKFEFGKAIEFFRVRVQVRDCIPGRFSVVTLTLYGFQILTIQALIKIFLTLYSIDTNIFTNFQKQKLKL